MLSVPRSAASGKGRERPRPGWVWAEAGATAQRAVLAITASNAAWKNRGARREGAGPEERVVQRFMVYIQGLKAQF